MKVSSFIKEILLLLVICSACTTRDNTTSVYETTIELDASGGDISAVVDSITFIGIGDVDGHFVKRCGKVRVSDGKIFIADDCFTPKRILVYNEADGSPCFVLDALGSGPEEYLEIRSFAVDSAGIYIIDNYNRRLMVFDSNSGRFIKSMPLPIIADDVETLCDGGFVLAVVPMHPELGRLAIEQDNCRLFITDGDLNIVETRLDVMDGEEDVSCLTPVFSRNEDKIFFGSVMFDGYFEFDADKSAEPAFNRINFENGMEGVKNLPLDAGVNYDHIIYTPVATGRFVFVCYASSGGYQQFGVWDKKSRQFLRNDLRNPEKLMLPVVSAEGNRFIAYLQDYEGYLDMVEQGFDRAPAEVERQMQNEGAALLFYHMKK